jgi:CBS domain-containing protein
MNKKKITSLLVTSEKDLNKKNKKLIGIVHIHSILKFGVK